MIDCSKKLNRVSGFEAHGWHVIGRHGKDVAKMEIDQEQSKQGCSCQGPNLLTTALSGVKLWLPQLPPSGHRNKGGKHIACYDTKTVFHSPVVKHSHRGHRRGNSYSASKRKNSTTAYLCYGHVQIQVLLVRSRSLKTT